jgi:nicotinamidase-related amidase
MDAVDLLRLTTQYYRAHPSTAMPGPVQERTEFPVAQTAFVPLRIWNVGFPDGPPVPGEYFVDMGLPETHALAAQIVEEWIRPAVPGYARERVEKVHGPGSREWAGWEALDAPDIMRPRPEDLVVATSTQFDRLLRREGIVNLIYAGCCTNLCVLDAEGGMKPMGRLAYRTVLLREATLACEFPDTLAERLCTRIAIRHIETWVGLTASAPAFIDACRTLAAGRDGAAARAAVPVGAAPAEGSGRGPQRSGTAR